MMTNGDPEGRIFLSHPHANNGSFFLLTTWYHILYWKNMKRLPENPKFADMRRHFNVNDVTDGRATNVQPVCSCSIFIFPTAGTGM